MWLGYWKVSFSFLKNENAWRHLVAINDASSPIEGFWELPCLSLRPVTMRIQTLRLKSSSHYKTLSFAYSSTVPRPRVTETVASFLWVQSHFTVLVLSTRWNASNHSLTGTSALQWNNNQWNAKNCHLERDGENNTRPNQPLAYRDLQFCPPKIQSVPFYPQISSPTAPLEAWYGSTVLLSGGLHLNPFDWLTGTCLWSVDLFLDEGSYAAIFLSCVSKTQTSGRKSMNTWVMNGWVDIYSHAWMVEGHLLWYLVCWPHAGMTVARSKSSFRLHRSDSPDVSEDTPAVFWYQSLILLLLLCSHSWSFLSSIISEMFATLSIPSSEIVMSSIVSDLKYSLTYLNNAH